MAKSSAASGLSEHEVSGGPESRSIAGDEQRGDAGLPPCLQVLTNLLPGTDQRQLFDQAPRNGGRRVLLLALEIEILDLPDLCLVAHPDRHIGMEVRPLGAHPAEVERVHR